MFSEVKQKQILKKSGQKSYHKSHSEKKGISCRYPELAVDRDVTCQRTSTTFDFRVCELNSRNESKYFLGQPSTVRTSSVAVRSGPRIGLSGACLQPDNPRYLHRHRSNYIFGERESRPLATPQNHVTICLIYEQVNK